MADSIITRRDFLRVAAGTAAATLAGGLPGGEARAAATATVVLVRHAEAVGSDGRIRFPIVQAMLDDAVGALFGTDPREAWRGLVTGADVVGIKTNAWYRLPTPPEAEEAIKRRVVEAGVAERNIGIDDRGVLDNPLFGRATALINVRPLRTHHWAGVGTCLKNYIMFVPNPSDYHADGCSPLGKIWTYPIVKGKTRLNVLVALTPQFYGRGANFFDRRYVWPYGGLIVGTDPVAVDTIGAHLLQTKRIAFFGEDRALDVPPVHITVADKTYHLGVSDRSRIRLIRSGWPEGALI